MTHFIVLPVYNGEKWLRGALESVFAQTRGDWELLLVDDASADGSRAMLEKVSDPRVRKIFNPSNRGLYPVLRDAVASAPEGSWVTVLMQDDRLKPDYLESMARLAEAHPSADAIWAEVDTVGPDGSMLKKGVDSKRSQLIVPGVRTWVSVLKKGCVWTVSGSFTKASFFRRVPMKGEYPHCGDYEWLLRAVREGAFLYYERPLTTVMCHAGQASTANLMSLRDIEEHYAIIRANALARPREIPASKFFVICFGRALLCLKRVARSALHGRAVAAAKGLRYAAAFVALYFRFLAARILTEN